MRPPRIQNFAQRRLTHDVTVLLLGAVMCAGIVDYVGMLLWGAVRSIFG